MRPEDPTARQVLEELKTEFKGRKFVAGLLIAFIDFLQELDALGGQYRTWAGFLSDYPPQERLTNGRKANTLHVLKPDGQIVSIRKYYNRAETFFRSEKKRFDYPNCAPHATQVWADYTGWLEALVGMRKAAALRLRAQAVGHVLAGIAPARVLSSNSPRLARHSVRGR